MQFFPPRVWDELLQSVDCGDEVGRWLSSYLKRDGIRMHFSALSLDKKDLTKVKRKFKHPAQPGDLVSRQSSMDHSIYDFTRSKTTLH